MSRSLLALLLLTLPTTLGCDKRASSSSSERVQKEAPAENTPVATEGNAPTGPIEPAAPRLLAAATGAVCEARDPSIICHGRFSIMDDGDESPRQWKREGVHSVDVAATHACAVTHIGFASCWGQNAFGQLGDGTRDPSPYPVGVDGLGGVVEVAVGGNRSCARLEDGRVMCWGNIRAEELSTAKAKRSGPLAKPGDNGVAPIEIPAARGAKRIAAGDFGTCAITADDRVLCFGGLSPAWPHIVLEGGAKSIAVGHNHGCAAMLDGTVRCFGANDRGQLGYPGQNRQPLGVRGVVEVAAGNRTSCARTKSGDVTCWGANSRGEVGGDDPNVTSPRKVSDVKKAKAIAVGHGFACALVKRSLTCWGADPRFEKTRRAAADKAAEDAWQRGPKLCPQGKIALFREPGCGGDVPHKCVTGIPPCATQYCSCAGRTVIGCGGATSPFRHEGPCQAEAPGAGAP